MDWVEVKDRLPTQSIACMLRLDTGEEIRGYHHADKMGRMAWYIRSDKSLMWQRKDNLEFIDNVVAWIDL